jgi:hypothetical protein
VSRESKMVEAAKAAAELAMAADMPLFVLRFNEHGEVKITGSRPPAEVSVALTNAITAVEKMGWRLEHFNGDAMTLALAGSPSGSGEEWNAFAVFRRVVA